MGRKIDKKQVRGEPSLIDAQAPKRNPRGVMVLLDDQALDDAAKEIKEDFEESIRRSEAQL